MQLEATLHTLMNTSLQTEAVNR